jgi:hypothetical protein
VNSLESVAKDPFVHRTDGHRPVLIAVYFQAGDMIAFSTYLGLKVGGALTEAVSYVGCVSSFGMLNGCLKQALPK